MGKAQEDLGIVGKIPSETIFKIADLVDEDIITKGGIGGIEDILGENNVSIGAIVRVFHNIVTCKDHPEIFMKFVDSTSDLLDKEKDTLKEVVRKIHNKVDADKITTNINVNQLEMFGHRHVQKNESTFFIASEFRPILKDGKIVKMLPLLVMDLPVYDPRGNSKPVNFQMNLEDAEWLADLLNDNIKSLKIEIHQMREKFGSEVI